MNKKYLTYNNIINLYSYMTINIEKWEFMRIDRIRKLYYLFFNDVPDKISISGTSYNWVDIITSDNLIEKEISNFNIIYNYYIIKNKYNRKELFNSDKLILFFTYYITSFYQDNPNILEKKYFKLFSNSEFINNNIRNNVINNDLNLYINRYIDYYENQLLKYKRISKIINIKNKL